MSFNSYYQREMIALRTLGREFAERNPALGASLGTPGRDPDVERVLEGFAFLTGRLWQKLDDELPEITHALFNLLWPHYLRPVPACSILKYQPTANLSKDAVIPRGTEVESEPVEGTCCTFTTVYDTNVLPLALNDLSFITKHGEAVMSLHFTALGMPVDGMGLDRLRFFLTGENAVVHTLYYYLTRKVKEIRFMMRGRSGREYRLARLAQEAVQPVGFADDEELYPYPPNAFPGYRILQEYFCFPEKYHFVDISGLGKAFASADSKEADNKNEFWLHIVLQDLPANFESFKADNIQLFCTPVVNLFPKSATPINLSHKQTEYRIVPDPRQPYHFATHSVLRVESWGHDGKGDREYAPFESFEHVSDGSDVPAYYRLRIRPSVKDESIETYISIVEAPHSGILPQNETISLELLCTNRMLPSRLGVGDIRIPGDNAEAVSFKNITPVTPPYMPPLEGDMLWRLLSNMSLNYIPLTSIEALKGIISSYDFRAPHDSRRARVLSNTLAGMVKVSSEEADRIYKGLPIRGARTTLTLNPRKFTCEGDMFLFASVINEFLALYATVNSFHQLIVSDEKSGEEYQWPARLGRQGL